MATVINNPPGTGDGNNAAGAVITGLVVIVIVILFFIYGLPRMRGTQVNVPDTINVNTDGGGQ